MTDNAIWLGIALGFTTSALFVIALAYARAGSLNRAWWGLTVAGRGKQDPAIEAKINAALGGSGVVVTAPAASPPPPVASKPTSPPPPATKTSPPPPPPALPKPGEPLRLLALLQSEARLLDFLMEDVSGATDAQIGQGVREVHKKAAAALKKYLAIEPVMGGTEGDRVTVQRGFDPSAVRVLGNVTGEPPYSGELQHPGWRVKEVKLPTVADGQDQLVLQPAEVQV
jgi:hypothetical protein